MRPEFGELRPSFGARKHRSSDPIHLSFGACGETIEPAESHSAGSERYDLRRNVASPFQSLRRLIPADQQIRHVLVLAGGTALGQGVVLLSTPILTRLYTRPEMGQYALFTSFLGFGGVLVTMRYENQIPLIRDEHDANAMTWGTIVLSAIIALLGAALFGLLIYLGLFGYGSLGIGSSVGMFMGLAIVGAYTSLRFRYIRDAKFKEIGGTQLSQGIGRAVAPIVLAPVHLGWVAVAVGEVLGRSLGVFGLFKGWLASMRGTPGAWKVSESVRLVSRYIKPQLILTASSCIDVLAIALPAPMITSAFGLGAAGLFMVAQRLCQTPLGFISGSFGDVFHNSVGAAVGANDTEGLIKAFHAMTIRLARIGLVIVGPIAVLAPFLANPVLGKDYAGVGPLISAIALWAYAGFIVSPLSRVLASSQRFEMKIAYDVCAMTGMVAPFVFARNGHWSFINTMLIVSAAQFLSYILYYFILRKALTMPFRPHDGSQIVESNDTP